MANLTDTVQSVLLQQSYLSPVVFVLPPSFNGPDPAVVRIGNVQSDRFDIFLREPGNKDGSHGAEAISYLVLEAGTWQISDGTLLEGGAVSTDATVGPLLNVNTWETINLELSFGATPVVISQVQDSGGAPYLKTPMSNITGGGFDLALEKPENATSPSAAQTIGYLAIESTTGQ